MTTLNDALAAIPGVAAIDAALKAAKKRPMPAPQADLVAEMVDHFKAGGGIPDDLGQRAYDLSRVREYMGLRNGVLMAVEAQLKNERDNLIYQNADPALDFLRERFDSVLDEGRELLDGLTRSGVRGFETAARAGEDRLKDWFRFEELAGSYAGIRSAQYTLCRDLSYGPYDGHQVITWSGELRERDNLWTTDQPPRGHWINPPWPHTSPKSGTPTYDAEYLRWVLITPEARPWLPSLADLRADFDGIAERKAKRDAEAAANDDLDN